MNKILNFINKNSLIFLFSIFFILYLTFGLYITFLNNVITEQWNWLFEADCPRIYYDLTQLNADHYRTKVHPLQLILLQPIVQLISTFTYSLRASVLIFQALSGAFIVCLIKEILQNFTKNNAVSFLFAGIYGLSLSTLFFSAIPETYIFGALFNSVLFYYLSILYTKAEELNNKNYLFLGILTTFSFGIIPLSIIPNLLLIICLLINKKQISTKKNIHNIAKILLTIVLLFVSLSLLQKTAYPHCPIFFKGAIKEDVIYMNFQNDYSKFKKVIDGTIIESLYSVKYEIKPCELGENIQIFYFSENQNAVIYIPFALLLFIPLIYYAYKKKTLKEYSPILITLGSIYILNFIQYYFYNPEICFLFSQNVLLYIVIALGILLSKLPNKILLPTGIGFIIYQSIMNFPLLSTIEKFIRQYSNKHYSFGTWLLYAIISLLLVLVIYFVTKKILRKDLLEKDFEEKSFWITLLFLIFIIINTIFLAIFHGRI